MTVFLMIIHALACVLLMVVILMQSRRGGGLTEGFAQAESMFGAKTNDFMVRSTTILGAVFLVTSLSLAYLSSKSDQSLMSDTVTEEKLPDINIPIEIPSDTPDQGQAPAPSAAE